MCQNVYGCRVVQRLLMYADQDTRDQIVEAVLTNVVANAVDTYSNYVIQHILVNGPEDARQASLLCSQQLLTTFPNKQLCPMLEQQKKGLVAY